MKRLSTITRPATSPVDKAFEEVSNELRSLFLGRRRGGARRHAAAGRGGGLWASPMRAERGDAVTAGAAPKTRSSSTLARSVRAVRGLDGKELCSPR